MSSDAYSKLLAAPAGTAIGVVLREPHCPSELCGPGLAVRAPEAVAQAIRTGLPLPRAISMRVVQHMDVSFFICAMVVAENLWAFTFNPGFEGVLEFLERMKAQQRAPVVLVVGGPLESVTLQELPSDELAEALLVARRRPQYSAAQYNAALTSFLSGRSPAHVIGRLFSRDALQRLAMGATSGANGMGMQ